MTPKQKKLIKRVNILIDMYSREPVKLKSLKEQRNLLIKNSKN